MRQSKVNLLDTVQMKTGDWVGIDLLVTGHGIYPQTVLQRVNPKTDKIVLFLSRQESDGNWKQVLTYVDEKEVEVVK